jgi:crotonobetainyl-CoA:carnitine CoA-transferase CaiB-like acyl-CoA transferase
MRAVGLADEPRFADFEACLKHHEELHAHLRAWFAARSAASLEEDFVAAGAPGTIVMSAGDLLVHPQVLARGMVLTLDDEDLGEIRMQNVVPRFSLTPGKVRHAGQRMGQANSEVYAELGIDADELAELEHQGVV